MSNRFIKVPENIFNKANERGLFTTLIHWYKLKLINIEGKFYQNQISLLAAKLQLSTKSVYAIIAKMLKLGWLRKSQNVLSLISYDKLFFWFGYSLKTYIRKSRFERKGNFKIFKIQINFKYFTEYIVFEEIKLNFQRQNYIINKKRKALGHFINSEITTLIQTTNLENCINTIRDKYDINILPMISVRKISDLLGFTSSSTGYNIQRNLEKLNLIKIFKRNDQYGPLCSIITPIFYNS